jgi:hypothetical protein
MRSGGNHDINSVYTGSVDARFLGFHDENENGVLSVTNPNI